MAYKDKERQKQANREASRRCRLRQQQGMTQDESKVIPVIPKQPENVIPNYGQPNCQCRHCQTARTNKSKNVINHGSYKTASQLVENEINRVILPGDPDYEPTGNPETHDYDPNKPGLGSQAVGVGPG